LALTLGPMRLRLALVAIAALAAPLVSSSPAFAAPCTEPTPAFAIQWPAEPLLIGAPVSIKTSATGTSPNTLDNTKGLLYGVVGQAEVFHASPYDPVTITPPAASFSVTATWGEVNASTGVYCERTTTYLLVANTGNGPCSPGTVSALTPVWVPELARGRSSAIDLRPRQDSGVIGPITTVAGDTTTIWPTRNPAYPQAPSYFPVDGAGDAATIPVSASFQQGERDHDGNLAINVCNMLLTNTVQVIPGHIPTGFRVGGMNDYGNVDFKAVAPADCTAAAKLPLVFTFGTQTVRAPDWCEGDATTRSFGDYAVRIEARIVGFTFNRDVYANKTVRTLFSIRVGTHVIRRGTITVTQAYRPDRFFFKGTPAFTSVCIKQSRLVYRYRGRRLCWIEGIFRVHIHASR
jgi:hypothetical protein